MNKSYMSIFFMVIFTKIYNLLYIYNLNKFYFIIIFLFHFFEIYGIISMFNKLNVGVFSNAKKI